MALPKPLIGKRKYVNHVYDIARVIGIESLRNLNNFSFCVAALQRRLRIPDVSR